MTCLNGFFQDVYTESMAEALLKAEHGGASAVLASADLTLSGNQRTLNEELVTRLAAATQTLGEAVRGAKLAAGEDAVSRTWILLGDPAMRLGVEKKPTPSPAGSGCACSFQPSDSGTPMFGAVLVALAIALRARTRRGG